MRRRSVAVLGVACCLLAGCGEWAGGRSKAGSSTSTTGNVIVPTTVDAPVVQLTARVVARHPHDPTQFTEGLAFLDRDRLVESSGRYGQSALRVVDVSRNEPVTSVRLGDQFFGEGVGVQNGYAVQLTWKEGDVLVWSLPELQPQPGYRIAGEGWGLAFDGQAGRWVSSDGSDQLTLRDSATFAAVDTLSVAEAGRSLRNLNELEVVGDTIWANVWRTDRIVAIDRHSGAVTASVDLSTLNPHLDDPEAVLNGIAHRPGDPPNRLWVTGKLWPQLFEVEVS